MPEKLEPMPAEERELNAIEINLLKAEVVEALRDIYDPEIPVNIYDLGLIYEIDVTPKSDVQVVMTLTSPACPVAESLPLDVEKQVAGVRGVKKAVVELTWDPPFTLERMSDEVKLMLGLL